MRAGALSLVLSSSSPRRRELLGRLGISPTRTAEPDIDESSLHQEAPRACALRLARAKALGVVCAPDELVLAGDTIVALGNRMLAKALTDEDVALMLARLSGRRHTCLSAVALADSEGRVRARISSTVVAFKRLTHTEIDAYVASGEGLGKAGGYAIQGRAESLVRFLHGSHSGVMGLPLFETRALLDAAGFQFSAHVSGHEA